MAQNENAEASSETVMVVCRMRPFNKKEIGENRGPCIDLDTQARTVTITLKEKGEAKGPPQTFTYDSVHGEDTVQIDFYNTACRKLVDSVREAPSLDCTTIRTLFDPQPLFGALAWPHTSDMTAPDNKISSGY